METRPESKSADQVGKPPAKNSNQHSSKPRRHGNFSLRDKYEAPPPPNRLAERRLLRKTVALREKDVGSKKDVLDLWQTIENRMPELRFSVKRRLKADELAKRNAFGNATNKRNARHRHNVKEATKRNKYYEKGIHNFLGTGLPGKDEYVDNRKDLFYETRLWGEINQTCLDSEELTTDYPKLVPRRVQMQQKYDARKLLEGNGVYAKKESYLKKMDQTKVNHEKAQNEARSVQNRADSLQDEADELLEELRGATSASVDFNDRMEISLRMNAAKSEAKVLSAEARVLSDRMLTLDRHVQLYGFAPEGEGKKPYALRELLGGATTAFGELSEKEVIRLQSIDLGQQVRDFEQKEWISLVDSIGMNDNKKEPSEEVHDVKRDKKNKGKKKSRKKTKVDVVKSVVSAFGRKGNKRPKQIDSKESHVQDEHKDKDKNIAEIKKEGKGKKLWENVQNKVKDIASSKWDTTGKRFGEIIRIGRMMSIKDNIDKREIERERSEKAREMKDKEEDARRTLAKKQLEALSQGISDKNTEKRHKKERLRLEKEFGLVDHDVAAMGAPNTNFQRTRDETGAVFGHHRVIKTNPLHVPVLCKLWVLSRCPKDGIECLGRHYFCNEAEKNKNLNWREEMERLLERPVIECISRREYLLELIRKACTKAQRNFEEHFGVLKSSDVAELLALLDQLRVTTVEVLECMKRWREAIEEQTQRVQISDPSMKKGWSVKLAVEGNRLYKGSPAFETRAEKRKNRGPTKDMKAFKWIYLGIFKEKLDAFRAYDSKCKQEAIRMQIPSTLMPPRKFVIRPCGHNSVESDVITLKPNIVQNKQKQTKCEICVVRNMDRAPSYKAPWNWNGQNYILKMSHDCDFLASSRLLAQWLGPKFSLIHNPLIITNTLDEARTPQPLSEALTPRYTNSSNTLKKTPLEISMPQDHLKDKNAMLIEGPAPASLFGRAVGRALINEKGGVTEWFGHSVLGTKVIIGKNRSYIPGISTNLSSNELDEKTRGYLNRKYEILTMERVRSVEQMLLEEEDIYQIADLEDSDSESEPSVEKLSKELEELETARSVGDLGDEIRTSVFRDKSGAEMPVEQRMKVMRDKGMFCSPYGQGSLWAADTVRGTLAKRFNYFKRMRIKGEKLIQERKRVQLSLQKAQIQKDKAKMKSLIPYAKELGGQDLEVEAHKAKNLLTHMANTVKKTQLMQRLFRGWIGRCHFYERKKTFEGKGSVESMYEAVVHTTSVTFVKSMMKRAMASAICKTKKPEYTEVKDMDYEQVVVSIHSNRHHDFFHEWQDRGAPPCICCQRKGPRLHMHLKPPHGKPSFHLQNGICTCAAPQIPEQIRIVCYNPSKQCAYVKLLSNFEVKRRLRSSLQCGKLPRDSLIKKAIDLEPMPTDWLLGFNQRPLCYSKRTRFEPILEAHRARFNASRIRTHASHKRRLATRAQQLFQSTKTSLKQMRKKRQRALEQFALSHSLLLRAIHYQTAMITSATKALAFSKRQVELLNMGGKDPTRVFDPLENASDHVYLRRKRESVKSVIMRTKQRFDAYSKFWRTSFLTAKVEKQLIEAGVSMATSEEEAVRAEATAAKATKQETIVLNLANSIMKHIVSLLTLRTPCRPRLRRQLVWWKDTWVMKKRILWNENPTGIYSKWLTTVKQGWNVLWRSVHKLSTPWWAEEEDKQKATFLVTIRWERNPKNENMPQHILIEGVRSHAERDHPQSVEEVLLRPLEYKEVLYYDHENRMPSLFKPLKLTGVYAHQRLQWARRRHQIGQALLRMLRINAHSGLLECGKVNYWRQRRLLVNKLYRCRWWWDITCARTSAKGVEVCRIGRKLGLKRCILAIYDNNGDLLFEAYEPRTGLWTDLKVNQVDLVHAMARKIGGDPVIKELWENAMRTGLYPRQLLQELLKLVQFERIEDVARLISAPTPESMGGNTKIQGVAIAGPRASGARSYCVHMDCPLGLQMPEEFNNADETGRCSHRCSRCRNLVERRDRGWMKNFRLVMYRRESDMYSKVYEEKARFISQRRKVHVELLRNKRGSLWFKCLDRLKGEFFNLRASLPQLREALQTPKEEYLFKPGRIQDLCKYVVRLLSIRKGPELESTFCIEAKRRGTNKGAGIVDGALVRGISVEKEVASANVGVLAKSKKREVLAKRLMRAARATRAKEKVERLLCSFHKTGLAELAAKAAFSAPELLRRQNYIDTLKLGSKIDAWCIWYRGGQWREACVEEITHNKDGNKSILVSYLNDRSNLQDEWIHLKNDGGRVRDMNDRSDIDDPSSESSRGDHHLSSRLKTKEKKEDTGTNLHALILSRRSIREHCAVLYRGSRAPTEWPRLESRNWTGSCKRQELDGRLLKVEVLLQPDNVTVKLRVWREPIWQIERRQNRLERNRMNGEEDLSRRYDTAYPHSRALEEKEELNSICRLQALYRGKIARLSVKSILRERAMRAKKEKRERKRAQNHRRPISRHKSQRYRSTSKNTTKRRNQLKKNLHEKNTKGIQKKKIMRDSVKTPRVASQKTLPNKDVKMKYQAVHESAVIATRNKAWQELVKEYSSMDISVAISLTAATEVKTFPIEDQTLNAFTDTSLRILWEKKVMLGVAQKRARISAQDSHTNKFGISAVYIPGKSIDSKVSESLPLTWLSLPPPLSQKYGKVDNNQIQAVKEYCKKYFGLSLKDVLVTHCDEYSSILSFQGVPGFTNINEIASVAASQPVYGPAIWILPSPNSIIQVIDIVFESVRKALQNARIKTIHDLIESEFELFFEKTDVQAAKNNRKENKKRRRLLGYGKKKNWRERKLEPPAWLKLSLSRRPFWEALPDNHHRLSDHSQKGNKFARECWVKRGMEVTVVQFDLPPEGFGDPDAIGFDLNLSDTKDREPGSWERDALREFLLKTKLRIAATHLLQAHRVLRAQMTYSGSTGTVTFVGKQLVDGRSLPACLVGVTFEDGTLEWFPETALRKTGQVYEVSLNSDAIKAHIATTEMWAERLSREEKVWRIIHRESFDVEQYEWSKLHLAVKILVEQQMHIVSKRISNRFHTQNFDRTDNSTALAKHPLSHLNSMEFGISISQDVFQCAKIMPGGRSMLIQGYFEKFGLRGKLVWSAIEKTNDIMGDFSGEFIGLRCMLDRPMFVRQYIRPQTRTKSGIVAADAVRCKTRSILSPPVTFRTEPFIDHGKGIIQKNNPGAYRIAQSGIAVPAPKVFEEKPVVPESIRSVCREISENLVIHSRGHSHALGLRGMWWEYEIDTHSIGLKSLHTIERKAKESGMKIAETLKIISRQWQLRNFFANTEEKRLQRHYEELGECVGEWEQCLSEDRTATALRPYLCMPENEMNEFRAIFEIFDTDKSGQISRSEFASLVYEVTEHKVAMTSKESREAVKRIDLNGNGQVDFFEFIVWWTMEDHSDQEMDNSRWRQFTRHKLDTRKILKSYEAKAKANAKKQGDKLKVAAISGAKRAWKPLQDMLARRKAKMAETAAEIARLKVLEDRETDQIEEEIMRVRREQDDFYEQPEHNHIDAREKKLAIDVKLLDLRDELLAARVYGIPLQINEETLALRQDAKKKLRTELNDIITAEIEAKRKIELEALAREKVRKLKAEEDAKETERLRVIEEVKEKNRLFQEKKKKEKEEARIRAIDDKTVLRELPLMKYWDAYALAWREDTRETDKLALMTSKEREDYLREKADRIAAELAEKKEAERKAKEEIRIKKMKEMNMKIEARREREAAAKAAKEAKKAKEIEDQKKRIARNARVQARNAKKLKGGVGARRRR